MDGNRVYEASLHFNRPSVSRLNTATTTKEKAMDRQFLILRIAMLRASNAVSTEVIDFIYYGGKVFEGKPCPVKSAMVGDSLIEKEEHRTWL